MHRALFFQQRLEMRARRCRWRSEVARRHRGGAQVADAIEGLVQSGNDAGLPEQVQGAAGALYGFLVPQHVGPAWGHQHQIVKTHGFHRAGDCAHIAGVAGADQDETGLHGRAGKIALIVAACIAGKTPPPALLLCRMPCPPSSFMSSNLHPMLNVAIKAARAAGAIINRAALDVESVRIAQKQINDFVTEVDHASEQAVIETLLRAYPDHGILAEESGRKHGAKDAPFVWIIDPLDGTTNFIHGFPVYCVSIALAVKGRVEQAVVYDPTRNDLFTATRGRGAYLNERRIRVSKRTELKDCLVSTGFPFRPGDDLKSYLAMLGDVMQRTAALRRPGAAALDLAYVAARLSQWFFLARPGSLGLAAAPPWPRSAGPGLCGCRLCRWFFLVRPGDLGHGRRLTAGGRGRWLGGQFHRRGGFSGAPRMPGRQSAHLWPTGGPFGQVQQVCRCGGQGRLARHHRHHHQRLRRRRRRGRAALKAAAASFAHLIDQGAKVVDALETAVHAGKADVGYFVELLELAHHQLANAAGGHFAQPEVEQLFLDALDGAVDPPGADRALAQRQFERGEQLVVPVFDAAAVFFHDGRKAHVRALVSGKALAAGGALAPAADGCGILEDPGFDDLGFEVAAKGAFHGGFMAALSGGRTQSAISRRPESGPSARRPWRAPQRCWPRRAACPAGRRSTRPGCVPVLPLSRAWAFRGGQCARRWSPSAFPDRWGSRSC